MSANPLDQRIFRMIQDGIPIQSRPFDVMAKDLGCSSEDLLNRIKTTVDKGMIRAIGAVFSPQHLGYRTVLCGALVSPACVRTVAEQLNRLHEVTHNYLREHDWNLWFTLVAADTSRIEEILNLVRTNQGVETVVALPARRVFKIAVLFDLDPTRATSSDAQVSVTRARMESPQNLPSPAQIQMVRALQQPFPLVEEPFRAMAAEAKCSEDQLLEQIRRWLSDGTIRRFGARVRHHVVGYAANGMAVWSVPETQVQQFGVCIARFPQVSHCYERQVCPQWRYNLYAMIHAAERQQVKEVHKLISDEIGHWDHEILFSVEEFKKSAPVYFFEKKYGDEEIET
ncbi:MAG TPA: hypothetical protein PKH07_13500 [bacterium]|nr:hypothetical protein [bacterium]